MPKQSLLEQAKHIEVERTGPKAVVTEDDIELVIAWYKDEIRLSQLQKVKGFNSCSAAYSYIAIVSRELYQRSNGKA